MTPSKGTTAPSLLPLPNPIGLADTQRRGTSCLWCGVLLTPASAVALGEPTTPDGERWFPRGCRPCTRVRAEEALAAHRAFCELCVEVDVPCETRDALRSLKGGER